MRSVAASSNRFSIGLLAGLVAAGLAVPALAQPANDSCANATLMAAGSITGTTIAATNDATGNCGSSASSPDVWYRLVATQDGLLTAQTCGGAGWDTVLSIWSECPTSAGVELSCNDDSCALQSNVQTNITLGEDYYIRVAGFGGQTGAFTLTLSESEGGPGGTLGPDVVYSGISGTVKYGPVGGIYAYAYGTDTCNIGDTDLRWGNSWGGSPSIGFNAYRLHDGRLMQIGQSWVKKACCAAAGDGCGIGCNGVGGSMLGSGCMDVYGAGYNGSQGNLAKRSSLNAFTGQHSLSGGSGDAIFARLQIPTAEMNAANFPGAQYFAEGVYVGSDDAVANNAWNNASYRRVTFNGAYDMTTSGVTVVGESALYAWADHGLGIGVPDPSVNIQNVDVPDEGRFVIGSKVRDLGNGTWRYDYAILNLNSDHSGGSLSIPLPAGTTVTNAGFHDVNYHSGEPYSNTDWTVTVGAGSVVWASPQTFAQNPNTNALRWGTMYNFWFDADRAPADGTVSLGLFKVSQTLGFTDRVPSGGGGVVGDLNNDGNVDLTDLAILLANFGCSTPPCTGDVDGDGDADLTDLSLLLANFGL